MTDAFRMLKDPDGRVEYRTLDGAFVCMDLRTEDQRTMERAQADAAGRLDAWVAEEMQWLMDCARSVIHDKFVVPNTTSGGAG